MHVAAVVARRREVCGHPEDVYIHIRRAKPIKVNAGHLRIVKGGPTPEPFDQFGDSWGIGGGDHRLLLALEWTSISHPRPC